MIKATMYNGEILYNLRDICNSVGVSYDDVISKHKMKNSLEIMEYMYDTTNECWVSRAGIHILFYNSNVKIELENIK